MMIAKYAGTCTKCKNEILVGAPINWVRGFGASHIAGTCSLQPIVVATMPVIPTVSIDGAAIVAFLTAARTRGLKLPKARFLAPDGRSEMRLSLAGGATKYPGAVQVKVNGEWKGRINADGSLTNNLVTNGFTPVLTAVATDPATAAKAYGALMGCCTFCGLQLTDAGSVEVGYGPICAAHWGLPHSPKGTPSLTAVAHV